MWKTIAKNKLESFVNGIRNENPDSKIQIIESMVLIESKGAFVSIESKKEAENLFLSNICIITGSTLVNSYEDVLDRDFSQACFVTAESKTADIEKKLVSGVHGPKECIFVILQ